MSTNFYKIWLPLSVVVNIVLLGVLLLIVRLMPVQASLIKVHYVGSRAIEVVKPVVPDQLPVPPPVKPSKVQPAVEPATPQPVVQPKQTMPRPHVTEMVVEKQPGVKNPDPNTHNTGYRGLLVKNKPKGQSGSGSDKVPGAAPPTLHGSGHQETPIGRSGGEDTGNNGSTKAGGGGGGGETKGATVLNSVHASCKDAAAEGRHGVVQVLITISASGSVTAANTSVTSGYADMDRAAERKALQLRCEPELRDGQPVTSTKVVAVPVN